MRVLIVNNGIIPVTLYGGTERVIWALGKELVQLGHEVSYLVNKGSHCDFATVFHIDEEKTIVEQIPKDIDIIHFNMRPPNLEQLDSPYIITMHGNSNDSTELDKNTVFVSSNHAERYNSDSYVYNGLDWDDYTTPQLNNKRDYFHFLGNAAWRVKNIKGAIDVIKQTKSEQLKVLGGVRFNFKMGLRFTFSPRIGFEGMVGGEKKDQLVNNSKGLLFPVRWHEPFGLAIIESLYFGCPVFGTPYGSLPELVVNEVGYLSNKQHQLTDAMEHSESFSRQKCHDYAVELFNSKKMALAYLTKYEQVLSGTNLNINNPKLKSIQTDKFLAWN